jgi:hypothetical protein
MTNEQSKALTLATETGKYVYALLAEINAQ